MRAEKKARKAERKAARKGERAERRRQGRKKLKMPSARKWRKRQKHVTIHPSLLTPKTPTTP
jgi:hypothetical protein